MTKRDDDHSSDSACAYCGGPGPLSREHILPKFLYRQFPGQNLGYSPQADRFIRAELQIKDVCHACNSGPLSELDSYARGFLTSIQCGRTYGSDQRISVSYRFAPLARWLLKVSYNAARARKNVPPLLKATVPYILSGSDPPSLAFVALEVIRDILLSPEDKSNLPPESQHWDRIPARMFRAGAFGVSSPNATYVDHCGRFVAINSWYFFICIAAPSSNRRQRRELVEAFHSLTPDFTKLIPGDHTIRIQVSRRTIDDVYRAQALRLQDKWFDYVEQTSGK